jgi:hypothetical protein
LRPSDERITIARRAIGGNERRLPERRALCLLPDAGRTCGTRGMPRWRVDLSQLLVVHLWDNCCAQHRAIKDYALPQWRPMARATDKMLFVCWTAPPTLWPPLESSASLPLGFSSKNPSMSLRPSGRVSVYPFYMPDRDKHRLA